MLPQLAPCIINKASIGQQLALVVQNGWKKSPKVIHFVI